MVGLFKFLTVSLQKTERTMVVVSEGSRKNFVIKKTVRVFAQVDFPPYQPTHRYHQLNPV